MPLEVTKGRLLDIAKPAGADVSDADAAVGEVLDPKTFYSVAPPRKTGTMPTVAITAANDDYPAGYHAGNVGGLDAIDPNLASANIKSGVTIFGFLGTLSAAPAHDTYDITPFGGGSSMGDAAAVGDSYVTSTVPVVMKTANLNVDPTAMVEGSFCGNCAASHASSGKIQLVIDGVQQAETGFLPLHPSWTIYELHGSKACSGAITVQSTSTATASSRSTKVVKGGHTGGYSVKIA